MGEKNVRDGLSKNFAPFAIYLILKKHSDAKNILTMDDIGEYLEKDYGIIMERKAISRNIDHMINEMDIEITKTSKGSWYSDSDDFEYSELHMIIDSLFCSRYIPENYTKDLIEKLCNLSSEYFKPCVKYTYSTDNLSKTENKALFTNIEIVDQAIASKKQIQFDYNKYGTDKKLQKTSTQIASPYRMVVHSGRYYLKGYNEKHKNMFYYKLDHITNMQILKEKATDYRTIKGYESGIRNEHIGVNLPYMYNDKQERITFLVHPDTVDQVVEWLGQSVTISDKVEPNGCYKASIITSPTAMKYFAMQYTDEIEILTPKHLRDEIVEVVERAYKKYSKD